MRGKILRDPETSEITKNNMLILKLLMEQTPKWVGYASLALITLTFIVSLMIFVRLL